MPTKAEELTPQSSDEETQAAISDCISQMTNEHPDWEQERVIAACHSMARRSTGKTIGGETPGGSRVKSIRRLV